MAISALVPIAFAQWNEQVLYSFQGYPDGAYPVGRIVFDKQSSLYGATSSGGSPNCNLFGCGTVYELSHPAQEGQAWTETILWTFKGLTYGDGATPTGGLIMDGAGNLYGTTAYGGTGQCYLLGSLLGCGIVFEMSPPSQPGGSWSEQVLYSFQGGNDGYFSWGDLVFDKAGNLYGATRFGGGKGTDCGDSLYPNCGTIFELSPPKEKGAAWTEKVLYSFTGIGQWSIEGDGAEPNGGLTFDEAGNIYGTTVYGGSSGISGDGVPCGGFYDGCGTVFELVAPLAQGDPWAKKTIHIFQGLGDGSRPNGGLNLYSGVLYGTTLAGGTGGVGTAYSLRPIGRNLWIESILYSFLNGHSANNPSALTLMPPRYILGTAESGGSNFSGAVFRLIPPAQPSGEWQMIDLYNFADSPDGAGPVGNLAAGGGGTLYGVTQAGGTGQACGGTGCGTVFVVWP